MSDEPRPARTDRSDRSGNLDRAGTASGDGSDRTGGTGRLRDLTAQIPDSKRIVPQRRGRLIVGLFATLIVLAIGAALFVLPIKSWIKQRDDLKTKTNELNTLTTANDQLQSDVDRLQTPAGIKEAARSELDYAGPGEKRITILPVGPAPTALPAGWPFDQVTRIIALRQGQATAAAAAAVPATTTATTPLATTAATTTTVASAGPPP
ncbi:MAG TPA: septum formation initiator family protein [Ilumatobacteraceae bacterium]